MPIDCNCLPHQVGIPRRQLAIAKAAPGPMSNALAARQLGRLEWDQAAMLHGLPLIASLINSAVSSGTRPRCSMDCH